ncbi:diguanylate cyclase domain-containing protein [Aquabacterium parvum]|uniref:diguanylate cyclase domain-containing protein n=1 Tax=Aquabacterium parvum TaxID=70584 RepID=UPI001F4148A3|nr:diguanylate cyclase [Aquabacterium parvum]
MTSSHQVPVQVAGLFLAGASGWMSWRAHARMRRALELAHRNESTWQACLQGSQDAVMVLERRNDMMGRFMGYTVVQANHQAHQLFRTDGLPLVGQLLKDVVPESEHGNFHQRVRLAAESGQAQVDEHASASPERQQAQRWLHHQIIPLPSGMALISRDTTEVHESIQALREQETFYRSAVDSLPMALYARSARAHNQGRYIVWNRQAAETMQMSAEQVLGRRACDVMPSEIAQRGDAHDQLVVREPRTRFFPNLPFQTPQGERLIDLIKTPVYGVDGQLDHILSIATDVTESRRAAEQLKLASRVMDETADAVVVSDALDRIVMVNPAFLKLMGLSRQEVIGQGAELLGLTPLRESHLPGVEAALKSGQRWAGECALVGADGRSLETWLAVTTLRGEDQRLSQHIRVLTDISVLKAQQRELAEQARRDSLTGLPNRRVFVERLRQAMARARRKPQTLAVMFIDLDGFKAINDRLGHAAGDKLLIEVATRLESCVRDTDCVCRLAGDEFTIILEGAGHPTEVHRIGQRILERLGQPCVIGEETIWPCASVGAALFEAQDSHDSLCQRADAAMYTAKRAGKARFVLQGDELAPHRPPSAQQACA